MPVATFLLLILAGVGAGLVGYLTGLASLVSYPALLAAGLPPVTANVTNTLSLVGAGVGTTARSGREFLSRGRRSTAIEVLVAAVGGVVGAAVLVETGDLSFSLVVPWLVLLASLLLPLSPRLQTMRQLRTAPRWAYYSALFVVCVYGGYFGAGAGVIYLVVAVLLSGMDFHHSVMVKTVLLAVSNLTAALFFMATVPVDWWAALAMGVGCVAGGYLGPIAQDLIPDNALRWTIAVAGVCLATWLWVNR